jgi:hypothetical protein
MRASNFLAFALAFLASIVLPAAPTANADGDLTATACVTSIAPDAVLVTVTAAPGSMFTVWQVDLGGIRAPVAGGAVMGPSGASLVVPVAPMAGFLEVTIHNPGLGFFTIIEGIPTGWFWQ